MRDHGSRQSLEGELANPAHRMAAWFLDSLISTVYIAPFVLAINALGTFDETNFDHGAFYGIGIPAYIGFILLLAHFDGSKRGQTPGKMVVGVRVRDQRTGEPIGFRRGLKRRLVYLVGGLFFYVGWIWGLFSARNQTWHDKVADSVVVRSRG